MRNVTYSDKLKQDPNLLRFADQATAYLESLVNRWLAPEVSAKWDRSEDERGQPLLTLALKQEEDEVTGSFAVKEFDDDREWKSQLSDLWGDVLRIHSHTILDELFRLRGDRQE